MPELTLSAPGRTSPHGAWRNRHRAAACGLALAGLAATCPANAAPPVAAAPIATPVVSTPDTQAAPPGLIGAWGDDSSCTTDVAIFKADGRVVLPQAPPGASDTSYRVDGQTITFTQGQRSGTYAFALTPQAVAWSDGVSMVLKSRCDDQAAFTKADGTTADGTVVGRSTTGGTAAGSTAIAHGSLFDQVRARATAPITVSGTTIPILRVSATQAANHPAPGPIHDTITAEPDPQAAGPGAQLFYLIFPTEAAATAYVLPSARDAASFLQENRHPGRYATLSAADTGPGGKEPSVSIACLRLHPATAVTVEITCVAHLPGTRLVAGGRQSFPLPVAAQPNYLGPTADLRETLDLTGLAIGQMRTFMPH